MLNNGIVTKTVLGIALCYFRFLAASDRLCHFMDWNPTESTKEVGHAASMGKPKFAQF